MPRLKKNLENNCKDIMDLKIKNIKPELYNQLLIELLNYEIENSKKIIEKFLRNKLQIPTNCTKKAKKYWIARGWTTAEAYIKSKENKQKNTKSVYSQQTWLERINPNTGENYTTEEADYERNSRRPIRKEYWIKKGYSEEESVELATNTKNENNKKGASIGTEPSIRRATSPRCVEYYTTRGFSEKEAILNVSAEQQTFSLEICKKKYGEIHGLQIWQTRQENWQDTLNKKSDEEKARINRLKLGRGYVVSKAEKILLESFQIYFPEIIHQFTLKVSSKKQYIYDFMYKNKIIEYNGDFWHCNPAIYNEDFLNRVTKLVAKDKWALDEAKIQFAQNQGYQTLVVWENDFKNNDKETIEKCIQFLTQ